MRLTTFVGLGLSVSVGIASASCNSPPQPAYADITYQTRCVQSDGTPITGGRCGTSTNPARNIYGFNGDMGAHFSCTITEHASMRTVNFTVAAQDADGTELGVSLSNAAVPAAGGALNGAAVFTWTDGNKYGGQASSDAPNAAHPCQIQGITFVTDTDTGLPRMDVNAVCYAAPSIPAATPEIVSSVTRAGNTTADAMSPMTIKFYSCPVISR